MTAQKKTTTRCKICNTEYDDPSDTLACIERCKAKRDMETLPALVIDMEWTTPQLEVMWKTVAKNTTVEEFAYFLNVAKAAKLNPFLREIYCWKDRNGNLTVMTGRDGYLTLAKQDPTFQGIQSMEVCKNDVFKMKFVDGAMAVETHEITDFNARGDIIGAWAIAKFVGQSPITVFASAADYFQSSKDVWKRTPAAMMRKVPESIALKRGAGISGLVTTEEVEVPEGIVVSGGIEVADADYVDVEYEDVRVHPEEIRAQEEADSANEEVVVPKPAKKPVKKPVAKSPAPKDVLEVTGLPEGKQMIPLKFSDELAEYNISDDYQINVKQLNAEGTHFDVNGTDAYTDRKGRHWSSMAGFSMSYGRVPSDVVEAIIVFGVEDVTAMHKKVAFAEFRGE